MQEHQMRAQAQAQGQQPQQQQQGQTLQQIPVNPNAEKKPEALAVAKFLRSQDLKTRVCVMEGQRKDMFKGMMRFQRASKPDTDSVSLI
jgi:translocation protein SEC62